MTKSTIEITMSRGPAHRRLWFNTSRQSRLTTIILSGMRKNIVLLKIFFVDQGTLGAICPVSEINSLISF
jgi:hypothetical protein